VVSENEKEKLTENVHGGPPFSARMPHPGSRDRKNDEFVWSVLLHRRNDHGFPILNPFIG
jgi:hypothetical protein